MTTSRYAKRIALRNNGATKANSRVTGAPVRKCSARSDFTMDENRHSEENLSLALSKTPRQKPGGKKSATRLRTKPEPILTMVHVNHQ